MLGSGARSCGEGRSEILALRLCGLLHPRISRCPKSLVLLDLGVAITLQGFAKKSRCSVGLELRASCCSCTVVSAETEVGKQQAWTSVLYDKLFSSY